MNFWRKYLKRLLFIIVTNFLFISSLDAQSLEIYKGVQVNRVDQNNRKQGLWVCFYDSLKTSVSQKGSYINDTMDGIWTQYYRNGNIKSSITYSEGKQNGYAILYYENGKISEEGLWKGNHWVGAYKYYHPSGKLAYEWNYNDNGFRNGQQKYFYDNGKLRVSGFWENGKRNGLIAEYYNSGRLRTESQWKNGKTNGIMKEYYENGSMKSLHVFNDGVYDVASSKKYARVSKEEPKKEEPVVVATVPEKKPDDDENIPPLFNGTGYHKIYSLDKRLEREGHFVNGIMQSGKRYYYNSNGDLIKIAVYDRGKVIEVIEK